MKYEITNMIINMKSSNSTQDRLYDETMASVSRKGNYLP